METLRVAFRVLFDSGATLIVVLAACFATVHQRRRLTTTLSVAAIATVILSVFFVPARGLTRSEQPFPDAFEIADATRNWVAGDGYVSDVHGNGSEPPRYPPGFSLFLAPFAMLDAEYPANIQHGVAFYACLYVAIAAAAAWSFQGPLAGAIAAALIGVSPFLRAYAALILSDALAAGLVVLLVVLLRRPTSRGIAVAGIVVGLSVTIRLPMVVVLPALLLVVPRQHRLTLVAGAAPPLLALGAYHWVTFGSPFQTGYSYWLPGVKTFSTAFALQSPMFGDGASLVSDLLRGRLLWWVCPCPVGGPQAALSNLVYYPSILLGLFWLYAPPFVSILGLLYAWQHRDDLAVKFSLWTIALTLVLFTFYFYQAARFMATPATILVVFASAKIATWMDRSNGRG